MNVVKDERLVSLQSSIDLFEEMSFTLVVKETPQCFRKRDASRRFKTLQDFRSVGEARKKVLYVTGTDK